MAERVDLDAVMDLGMQPFTGWTVAQWRTWQGMVPAMVAELRVAREVVRVARFIAEHDKRALPSAHPVNQLRAALNAYDRHAAPSIPAPAETPP